jgi:hypothetical protein
LRRLILSNRVLRGTTVEAGQGGIPGLVAREHYRGRNLVLSQCSTFKMRPMWRAYVPARLRPFGLGVTRSMRTVTTGMGGDIPLRSTSLNGVRTLRRRLVQYGLISRYSTRLVPATIFANHSRFNVVVMTSNGCSLGRQAYNGRLGYGTEGVNRGSKTLQGLYETGASKPHSGD